MPIKIPQKILEYAETDFTEDSAAGKWFTEILREHHIADGTSPADYPEDVWAAYKTLSHSKFGDTPPVFKGDQLKLLFAGLTE